MGPRVRALFFYRIWMGVVPVFSPCILPGGEDLPGPGGCRTISERSLIRSDRSPEDRRRIEGLTSKPRPNSEPALFFLYGEVYLFALSQHEQRR